MKYQGEMLKEMGDGMLASFHSALEAVEFATELLRTTVTEEDYELRIDIHLGEVFRSGGDVFGDGVNIASRIYAAAEPNSICISGEVYNNVRNKLDVNAVALQDVELKNIQQKVDLYLIRNSET